MNFFEELIKPLSIDDFKSSYYEKKHVHIKSENAARFSHLISFEKLDEMVGVHGLTAPDITVVNSKDDVSKSDYLWKQDLVDPVKVAGLFADGATIIFNALQDRFEPLRLLCSGITEDLQLRAQTNIYLTPPNSQGFNTHWDTHDVFVIQVEGSKDWKIYKEALPLPLEQPNYKFEKDCVDALNVIDEFVLEQGDILYIPRGVMHSASASNEKSLHVTLGITPYTWKSFFLDYIELISDKEADWRSSVSLLASDRESVKSGFESKLKQLQGFADIEAVINRHVSSVHQYYRPRTANLLNQSLESIVLEKTDIIMPHRHNTIEITKSEDNKVHVSSGAREIIFPGAAKKTIDLIFERNNQKIGEFNDDIDWDSRKVVITKLLKESLVFKTLNI
ncbi:MAG: cupin domain-containing protein [Gammaproteobacteria bacterium]|nr:cupin domain-containing protein [Gammaproteobacteria bacterium]